MLGELQTDETEQISTLEETEADGEELDERAARSN